MFKLPLETSDSHNNNRDDRLYLIIICLPATRTVIAIMDVDEYLNCRSPPMNTHLKDPIQQA